MQREDRRSAEEAEKLVFVSLVICSGGSAERAAILPVCCPCGGGVIDGVKELYTVALTEAEKDGRWR